MTENVRSSSWKWWVCGLLLLASAINYMDRQTLANAATRITREFQLDQEHYGNLELVFGWAFAIGSLLFGIAADRVSVRWLYPVVLLLWSAVGFATGLAKDYTGLLVCRTLLGLFEGGHWPCAIKTTQRLLDSRDRAMGNSVLQSGTSIGAILAPLLMRVMLTDAAGSWRLPFQVVGAVGLFWIVLWFALIGKQDLLPRAAAVGERRAVNSGSNPLPRNRGAPSPQPSPPLRAGERVPEGRVRGFRGAMRALVRGTLSPSDGEREKPLASAGFWRLMLSRRMLVIFAVVAAINTCWQTLRAWLPKFLQEGRGYAESDALYFNSLFYVATDVGCIGAGALTLWLAQRGVPVHGARSRVFLACAVLSALAVVAAVLPKGWPLLGVLLLTGAGALGVFPIYHAFTQEISAEHQGKVTGVASIAAWVFSSPAQKLFGRLIDRSGSFDLGLAAAGCLPLVAFVFLWLFWDAPGAKTNAAP